MRKVSAVGWSSQASSPLQKYPHPRPGNDGQDPRVFCPKRNQVAHSDPTAPTPVWKALNKSIPTAIKFTLGNTSPHV